MRGDGFKIGGGFALGLAVAVPLALWLAQPAPVERPRAVAADTTGMRQVFSPVVLRDPHVMAQQRKNVAALEKACADTGAYCSEARKARAALEKLER